MVGLKTPYDDTDPANITGGGLIQTQVSAHDNSIDEKVGGLNFLNNNFNTEISKPANTDYTDFYTEGSSINLTYVDASDKQFDIDGITPDHTDPNNIVEEFNTYLSNAPYTYVEAYNSFRFKEIKTILHNHQPDYLYTVNITLHDLDEWNGLSYSETDHTIYPREKVKVWCNDIYVGEIEAKENGGEGQTVSKSFNNIFPDHNGDIKVEMSLGFKWVKGTTPNSSYQSGIRVEQVKSYPTHQNIREPQEPNNNLMMSPFNYNNIPDPLRSGAPAQKISFLPRQLGKYIGFFQNSYYSNSNNSSDGSVGTQYGTWVGDMVEFNGVASRIMVDIENLPISNANSQTHSRSHTIANIPRFSQGGSNLGNIYYEASTPLYIKLKNPDEIILNYLDVVLRDVNGLEIDKGILDTNSVVVINIQ